MGWKQKLKFRTAKYPSTDNWNYDVEGNYATGIGSVRAVHCILLNVFNKVQSLSLNPDKRDFFQYPLEGRKFLHEKFFAKKHANNFSKELHVLLYHCDGIIE